MDSVVLRWHGLWSEFAVCGKVRIECSTSCLPCWWLCCCIDRLKMPLKCFSSLSPASSSSSKLLPRPSLPPNMFSVFSLLCLSICHFVSSHCLTVEYMMDKMERKSIMEEPVRKCPIPAPRTSVPSPCASPSLRHKSKSTRPCNWT